VSDTSDRHVEGLLVFGALHRGTFKKIPLRSNEWQYEVTTECGIQTVVEAPPDRRFLRYRSYGPLLCVDCKSRAAREATP